MKKRVISVLLIIALLVAVGVVTAQADPMTVAEKAAQMDFSSDTGSGVVMDCPACEATGVTWRELKTTDDGSSLYNYDNTSKHGQLAGHYYVKGELALPTHITGGWTNGQTLCIQLNGGKLTGGTTSGMFSMRTSTLNLMDTDGTGAVEAGISAVSIFNTQTGTVNVYGGNYSISADNTKSAPVVNNAGTGTLRLYNGTFTGEAKLSNASGTLEIAGGSVNFSM